MNRTALKLNRNNFGRLICLVVLVFFPVAAHADAGIPMLPFTYPVILLFLLPVIAIEAIYIKFRLHTEWGTTFSAVARANGVTMVLGYPLAWFICFLLELVTIMILAITGGDASLTWSPTVNIDDLIIVITNAAWLGPTEEKWVFPVAYIVLLIPSFVLSGYVESRLMSREGWLEYEGNCAKTVWQANILSYIFLALVGSVALYEVMKHL